MPTYTPLQSIQLASSSSTVTFSNIPQTYQDLVLVSSCWTGSSDIDIYIQFNSDTNSNYSRTRLWGNGSTANSNRLSNQTFITIAGANVTTPNSNITHIMNYGNTTTNKTTLSRSDISDLSTNAFVGLWRSTAAINSIKVYPQTGSFSAGSTFDLYGISPVAADTAQAFGGTEVYYDSTYVYHVFKGSGIFTPYRNLTCDLIVVAGGGGSGHAGGGAGGYLKYTSQAVTSGTNYSVIVGAGGATASSRSQRGRDGANSSFGSLTASNAGGGGGNGGGEQSGATGGSGGGGSPTGGTGGAAFPSGQGFAGGNAGAGSGFYAGGGGGGAGAVGAAGNSSVGGGAGGVGLSDAITGGSVTGVGQNVSGTYYLAGGGGGGSDSNPGSGGSGGGGAGSAQLSTNGTTNTGGGAGGSSNQNGANGGSGIVIVRYAR